MRFPPFLLMASMFCQPAVLLSAGDGPATDLAGLASPLVDEESLSPLMKAAAQARLVLLGESTHGTSEFYQWRAAISRKLIEEFNFRFIAVEGDWCALEPVNKYIQGHPDAPPDARAALRKINRWPLWMWANEEMAEFVGWLRSYNESVPPDRRVGLYGLDIYGMWNSLDAVLEFYREHAPETLPLVRELYSTMTRFHGNPDAYVRHVWELQPHAADEVAQVAEKLGRRWRDAPPGLQCGTFQAYQHARVVQAAEKHLRRRIDPGAASWNARAGSFFETVQRLLELYGPDAKGIVWAHNTHIGDARATDMRQFRQINIGQQAREQLGRENVFSVGLSTGTGNVLAAKNWEGERLVLPIPAPAPGSFEELAHQQFKKPALLLWPDNNLPEILTTPLPHRAIGVTYDPDFEPSRNYVPSLLPARYDAMLFFPDSRALTPLHP